MTTAPRRARDVVLLALLAFAAHVTTAGPSKEVIELRQSQHRCNVTEEPQRYMVFTRQRSGSRWFVNTISELGGEMGKTQFHYLPSLRELGLDGNGFMRFVNAARESGLAATACKHPKPSPECACLLRHVYAIKEHSKINNMNRSIGWKFMVKFQDSPRHNPFQNLNSIVASVCALDIPYVLMLRRNVLRRYVSGLATEGQASHAATAAEVVELRRRKPRVPVEGLAERIAYEVVQNEELVQLFKYHCGSVDGRLFWYEDIVDAAPHHVELWSDLMVKLDLWKAPDPERVRNRAAASTHAVHATLPLSEVVANWDELAEALGGSVFEDMLA